MCPGARHNADLHGVYEKWPAEPLEGPYTVPRTMLPDLNRRSRVYSGGSRAPGLGRLDPIETLYCDGSDHYVGGRG